MTADEMRALCVRVMRTQEHRSFTRACQFIADCADLPFQHVVQICQGMDLPLAKHRFLTLV